MDLSTTVHFATDVNAAVEHLITRKEIDKKKIGLIGHSEGGIIAPIVAGNSKDVIHSFRWQELASQAISYC